MFWSIALDVRRDTFDFDKIAQILGMELEIEIWLLFFFLISLKNFNERLVDTHWKENSKSKAVNQSKSKRIFEHAHTHTRRIIKCKNFSSLTRPSHLKKKEERNNILYTISSHLSAKLHTITLHFLLLEIH